MPRRAVDYQDLLNPESLQVLTAAVVEPALAEAAPEQRFQFEREGYFCLDSRDSSAGRPMFNRIVTLRDSWGKSGE